MSVNQGIELGRELSRTLTAINQQIEVIKADADTIGYPVYEMRDDHNAYALPPLLAAKAQTLHALVLVNQR